jgi:hypothetical protein
VYVSKVWQTTKSQQAVSLIRCWARVKIQIIDNFADVAAHLIHSLLLSTQCMQTLSCIQAMFWHWCKKIVGLQEQLEDMVFPNSDALLGDLSRNTPPRLRQLNKVVAQLVDGYGMVSFSTLNITDEDRWGRLDNT